MQIRKTTATDLGRVTEIYRAAREFMISTGNPMQWREGPPSTEQIMEDIALGDSYVVTDDGKILAVFMYRMGIDPTYITIENGKWQSDALYGVIHRIAVAEQGRGIAGFVFDTVFSWCGNIRIDTHEDNAPMRRALDKNGFKYCGVIHIANGDPRVAYQRV